MIIDGEETQDPTFIAQQFNNYLTNIAHNLASSIPPSQDNFQHFLGAAQNTSLTFDLVTERELTDIVKQLNNSAPGYDGITASVVKVVLPFISPVLLHLCNSSLATGIFPNKLKTAKVTPIFKSGSKSNIKNYRPISVLSVFSRILEKIVYIRLERYFTDNNLLSDSQYGFRRNRSTEIALVTLTNHI